MAASISMRRCCRAGAAPRRSTERSWPATRRPASPSCASTKASMRGRSVSTSARADRPGPDRRRAARRARRTRRAAHGASARRAREGSARLPAASRERRHLRQKARASPRRASTGRGRHTRCTIGSGDCRPIPAPGSRSTSAASANASACCAQRSRRERGRPARCSTTGLTVACGEGAVRLTEVQRAGKRPMAAADFLRGVTARRRRRC